MLISRVPPLLAAKMNSWFLIASTSPRTMRAVCIQLVMPITKTIRINIPVSGPNIARKVSRNSMIITSSSGKSGNARKRSVKRISGPSSHLTYPDNSPTTVPKNSDRAIATMPTDRDKRPPASTCASMSRPRLSVPKGWTRLGPWFFERMSRNCGSMVWM